MIKQGDMVVTSKGNYGRVITVNSTVAIVKIGYKNHEIELYNLINVQNGTHFRVQYDVYDGNINTDILFVKHGSVIWDLYDPTAMTNLLKMIEHSLIKKLNVPQVKILKISIP